MARIRNVFLGFVILGYVLTGCMTITCDPDDPKFGKDRYECTRKATVESGKSIQTKKVSSAPRTGSRTRRRSV